MTDLKWLARDQRVGWLERAGFALVVVLVLAFAVLASYDTDSDVPMPKAGPTHYEEFGRILNTDPPEEPLDPQIIIERWPDPDYTGYSVVFGSYTVGTGSLGTPYLKFTTDGQIVIHKAVGGYVPLSIEAGQEVWSPSNGDTLIVDRGE